jgi:S-DNA-T family DNA segregation ATPase FtsK/SpoIIIE
MFIAPTEDPRKVIPLPVDGVEIPAPLQHDSADTRSAWVKLLPLLMVAVIGAVIALWVMTGSRTIATMLFALPMLVMMGLMYVRGGAGGNNDAEIEQEVERYDLELRERRREVHDQGRALHELRTMCYPHPADLLSMVGGTAMWQADPDLNLHRAVPEDLGAGEDPYAHNHTGNPWLRARVGIGVAPLYPRLKSADVGVPELLERATMVRYQRAMATLSVVANLPIDVNLGEFPAYAVRGEDESARVELVRSMVMSLAFNHRPGDLEIGVVTEDPAAWEWMKWLPHTEDLNRVEPGAGPRLLTWRTLEDFAADHAQRPAAEGGRSAHTLLIVDTPESVVSWPPAMAGGVKGMTWLVVRYATDLVSMEESRILVDGAGRVSTVRDRDAAARDRVSAATAEAFAKAMQRYRPDGYGRAELTVARKDTRVMDFFEAVAIGDIETHDLPAVWRENAYTDEIRFPYGYRRNGEEILPELAYLNLYDENRGGGDGPHGAVAGRTGSGKSHFLKALVLGLVSRYGPEKVSLILADFKGGATFQGMSAWPHTVAVISNLEGATELVDRLGVVLEGELQRRQELFDEKQVVDIYAYRAEQQKHQGDPAWPPLPNLVVIIDEAGQFLEKNRHYLALLFSIGRIGRTMGLNLIMCSQKLDKTIMGDLLGQTAFRFCLPVKEDSTSRDLLGTDAAARMLTGDGRLGGKVLRSFPSDPVGSPAEVVAFNHEAPYVRRALSAQSRTGAAGPAAVSAVVVPFELISDREFTPAAGGEVIDAEVVTTKDTMFSVLRDRVAQFGNMKAVDLWKPSLREPVSLPTAAGGLLRETSGLRIRVGDIDDPYNNRRVAWLLDFSGAVPHQAIAGAAKSGRTTLLQTLVVSGALTHEPERLAFMLADFGAGKLGEVRESPNVAAYARPGDSDTVSRIIGEAARLIELRRDRMVSRGLSMVDAYLAEKAADPVPGDPYGYVIVAIDGIGGFLGDDASVRPENAKRLRPILDLGASVGVHLVYTADTVESGSAGNVPHASIVLGGGVQLPTPSVMSPLVPHDHRQKVQGWSSQPGRTVVLVQSELGVGRWLEARTMVPIPREIEPTGTLKGLDLFAVRDFGADVAELCARLREKFAGRAVTPVHAVPDLVDFDDIWDVFAPMVDPNRNPSQTLHPVGVRTDTYQLELLAQLDDPQQNLVVYGEKRSGRTNALRMVMASVMRQFTPDQASIIVIDPLRQLLGDRDGLLGSGFVAPAEFTEDDNGARVRIAPPGYVTEDSDIADVVAELAELMRSRMPSDETTGEQLMDRTYFSGREVYVFVDNINALLRGTASPFDGSSPESSVTALVERGQDLGVHFIVADDLRFADHVASSRFVGALRDKMRAPILQLSAPASAMSPVPGAHHLKPSSRRAGRGRLIIDADTYSEVQTPLVGVDALRRR